MPVPTNTNEAMTWPVAPWLPTAAPARSPAVQAGVPGGTGLACGDGTGVGVRSAGSAFQGIVPPGVEAANSGWSGPHPAIASRPRPIRRSVRLPITDRYDRSLAEVTLRPVTAGGRTWFAVQ